MQPATRSLSSAEATYLRELNAAPLDPQSVQFKVHVEAFSTTHSPEILWNILDHKREEPTYAVVHRNALLLLVAIGESLSCRNLSRLYAPDLDFNEPPIFENTNISLCHMPRIRCTGGYFVGVRAEGANLSDARWGINPPLIHQSSVDLMTCSSTQNIVATLANSILYVHNYQNSKELYRRQTSSNQKVNCILFSPNNNEIFLFVKFKKDKHHALFILKKSDLSIKDSYKFTQENKFISAFYSANQTHIAYCSQQPASSRESDAKTALHIWNFSSNGQLANLKTPLERLFNKCIDRLCFSPTTDVLVTARITGRQTSTQEAQTNIHFWSFPQLQKIAKWTEAAEITELQFAGDGESLILLDQNKRVYSRTLRQAKRFNLFEDCNISSLCYSSRNQVFAYVSGHDQICVRELQNGNVLGKFRISAQKLPQIRFSLQETELLVKHDDRISIFEVKEISRYGACPFEKGIDVVHFVSNRLITVNQNLEMRFYDAKIGNLVDIKYLQHLQFQPDPLYTRHSLISEDGNVLVCLQEKKRTKNELRAIEGIRVISIYEEKLIIIYNHPKIRSLAISKDGKHFLCLTDSAVLAINALTGRVGEVIYPQNLNRDSLIAISSNFSGKNAFALAVHKKILVFDDHKRITCEISFEDSCIALMFAVENQFLIIQSKHRLQIYDFRAEKIVISLQVNCLFFDLSKDGKRLLVCSKQGTISLWNIQDNEISKSSLKHSEFIPPMTLSGIRFCTDNSSHFVVWSDRDQCMHVHQIGRDVRKLLWRKPPRLEIQDVVSDHIIADQKTHAILKNL